MLSYEELRAMAAGVPRPSYTQAPTPPVPEVEPSRYEPPPPEEEEEGPYLSAHYAELREMASSASLVSPPPTPQLPPPEEEGGSLLRLPTLGLKGAAGIAADLPGRIMGATKDLVPAIAGGSFIGELSKKEKTSLKHAEHVTKQYWNKAKQLTGVELEPGELKSFQEDPLGNLAYGLGSGLAQVGIGLGAYMAGAPLLAMTVLSVQEYDGMQEQLVELGVPEEESKVYALGYTAIATVLEYTGIDNLVKLVGGKELTGVFLKKVAIGAMRQGSVEGLEEFSQEYAAIITEMLAGVHQGKPLDDFMRAVESGLIGGLVGVVTGGSAGFKRAVQDNAVAAAVEAAITADETDSVAAFRDALLHVGGDRITPEMANHVTDRVVNKVADMHDQTLAEYLNENLGKIVVTMPSDEVKTFQIGDEAYRSQFGKVDIGEGQEITADPATVGTAVDAEGKIDIGEGQKITADPGLAEPEIAKPAEPTPTGTPVPEMPMTGVGTRAVDEGPVPAPFTEERVDELATDLREARVNAEAADRKAAEKDVTPTTWKVGDRVDMPSENDTGTVETVSVEEGKELLGIRWDSLEGEVEDNWGDDPGLERITGEAAPTEKVAEKSTPKEEAKQPRAVVAAEKSVEKSVAGIEEGARVIHQGEEVTVEKVYEPGTEDPTVWVDLSNGNMAKAEDLKPVELDQEEAEIDRGTKIIEEFEQERFQLIQGEGKPETATDLSDDELLERMRGNREGIERGWATDTSGTDKNLLVTTESNAKQRFLADRYELISRLDKKKKQRKEWEEGRQDLLKERNDALKGVQKRQRSGFQDVMDSPLANRMNAANAEVLQLQAAISESRKEAMHLVTEGAKVLGIDDLGTPERPIGVGPETLMQEDDDNPLAGKDVRAAFRMKDGTIIESPKSRKMPMHMILAEARNLNQEEVESSGFTIDGEYTERLPERDPYTLDHEIKDRPKRDRKILTQDEDAAAHVERPEEEYFAHETGDLSGLEADNLEPTKENFLEVGDLQRGEPERAMGVVSHIMDGGVMQEAVMHIGDIIHRMSDSNTWTWAGYDLVRPKVELGLRRLKHRYGFDREFRENLKNNAEFNRREGKSGPTTEEEMVSQVEKGLQKYADEHRKLPTYNRAQELAQEAAVALGELRFDDSIKALEELNDHLGSQEEWIKFAHEGIVEEGKRPTKETPDEDLDLEQKVMTPAPEGTETPDFKKSTPKKFMAARKGTKYVDMLTPLTVKGIKEKRLTVYLSGDSTVGFTISPDGDIGNAFNNKGPFGLGAVGVAEAIRLGGKTLDAFDMSSEGAQSGSLYEKLKAQFPNGLPGYYAQFGFEVYRPSWFSELDKGAVTGKGRLQFDENEAPPKFDQELFGQPDVVYMRRGQGAKVRGLASEITEDVEAGESGFVENVRAAAEWFDKEYGKAVSKAVVSTPEERKGRAYLNSVTDAYRLVQMEDSGEKWYERFHDAVVELYDKFFPGVRTSPGMRIVGALLNGIISNGNDIVIQTKYALFAMASFNGKRFARLNPVNGAAWPGKRGPSLRAGIRRLNQFLADPRVDYNLETFYELVEEKRTAREWIQWMKDSPTVTSTAISEVLMDDLIPGYRIWGPKVGRYTANILGEHNEVTVDVWMIRWWSRMLGKAVDRKTGEPRGKLTALEVRELRQTVVDLANTFRVEPDQMQAMIWTMEKNLWEKATGRSKGTVSPDEFTAKIDKEVSDNGRFKALAKAAAKRLHSRSVGARGRKVDERDDRQQDLARPTSSSERTRGQEEEAPETLEQQDVDTEQAFGRNVKGKITLKAGQRAIIRFNKTADLSTVIHEIAHLALATMPADVKEAIRADMGLDPGEAFTREMHEKFARYAEAMLLSSKPPSRKVAEEWEMMRQEMLTIYGDSVTGLKPGDVPPVVRLVFEGLHTFEGVKTRTAPTKRAPAVARSKRQPSGKEPAGDDSFADKRLETAFNKARMGRPADPFYRSIASWVGGVYRRITRQFENIPETSKGIARNKLANPAVFLEALRRIENSAETIAELKVRRPIMNAVAHLSKKQRRVLDRLLFLRHLNTIAENLAQEGSEFKLPFGFDTATASMELARAEKMAAQDEEIIEAAEALKELWRGVRAEVRDSFTALGMPTDFLEKQGDNYLHHEILALEKGYGTNEKLRVPMRSWMKRLTGRREEDINLNYEQAQGAVLTQLLIDAEIARQIKVIKDRYNVRPKLLKAAKRTDTPVDELIPEGYAPWTPRGSKIFFKVMALTDKAAQEILENEVAEITEADLRSVMAVTDAAGLVIPAVFVEALENKAADAGRIGDASRKIMRFWKAWQLTSPRRILKYVKRNFIGDLTKALTWNPGTATKMKQSASELRGVIFGGQAPSPDLLQWLIRNGYSSGMMQQEYTPSDQERLRSFFEDVDWKHFAKKPTLGRWMALSRKNVAFMESVSRYASYLSYLEQMKASKDGKTPKNWGASDRTIIEGFDDVNDRAFWLSNQLLGAYDQISQTGRGLRRHAFPFWSFQELNAKSHYRLLKNALETDKISMALGKKVVTGAALKVPLAVLAAGRWTARAMVLEALVFAWNNAMWPDEEEDLPDDVRKTVHFIYGRDPLGNVLVFNRFGVFQEVREWFGLAGAPQILVDWFTGRITKQEAAQLVAEEFVEQGPFNKVVQGVGGPWKTLVELGTGISTFPSVTRMRRFAPPITGGDLLEPARLEFIARSVGLENEFKVITGRPSKAGGESRAAQYLRTLPEFFLYRYEPGRTQYQDTLNAKSRWERSLGKENWGDYWSSKSEVLRQFKRAEQYGQRNIAYNHLQEYVALGGTAKGALQSFRRMDPLYGLDDDELQAFTDYLGDRGKQRLVMAITYYEHELIPDDELEAWIKENLP